MGGSLVRRRRPQPSEHLGEEQFLAVSGVQLSSERIAGWLWANVESYVQTDDYACRALVR